MFETVPDRGRKRLRPLKAVGAAALIGAVLFGIAHYAMAGGDHAGHSHGTPSAQEHKAVSRTTEDTSRRHGIVVHEVGPGKLGQKISVPGEIRLNEDRVVHLCPRIGGLVREVRGTVGDTVSEGQCLAVLESTELGEAKLDYLAKLNEVGCCKILIPRLQAVHENTLKLLKFLDGNPSREELRSFPDLPMGGNRSELVGSYSEVLLARTSHAREKALRDKSISSERELLAAEDVLEKAESESAAKRDSIAFQIRRELAEAQAELRNAEFELKQAERHLQFLGIEAEEIRHLAELVTGALESDCPDLDCAGCRIANDPKARAAREAQKTLTEAGLTRHALTAPISGMIIERHIALGEHVNLESDVFTIADLSTVWVDLRVHERDLPALERGQEVTIQGRPGLPETRGVIAFVHPIVDSETRTVLARVVVENPEGHLRPGTFVTAIAAREQNVAEVVVPRDAVQYMEDQPVVFVDEDGEFKPREVILGDVGGGSAEIVFGLQAGERVAVKNSFRLKAELARQTAGAAGGCSSHAH